ncbi:MAG: phage tail protein [Clostridia bacterium]|nr:phage tail protein [Clostridia bacterium]
MIPILFENSTKLGWLKDCLTCEVTEERNGIFELLITYPANGDMAKFLSEEKLIKAKPNKTSENQFFKIYKVNKPINGIITVNAEHISYALAHYPVSSVSLSRANPTQAIGALLTNANSNLTASHEFSVATSDIAVNAAFNALNVSVRAALGGVEGSVLDTYGGEYEFDNYTIKLHKNRGSDRGVVISYGKNLTDIKCDVSSESSYTALYAYCVKDGVSFSLVKPVTNNSGIAAKVLMRDFSSELNSEEGVTVSTLNSAATSWLSNNDINALTVSMTVSFVDLSQSPEYASYQLLERVSLCDTVTVRHRDLGVDVKAKVIKTVYDVLGERYTKIELGSARANFSDTVKQLQKETQNVKKDVFKTESEITQAYLAAIDNATKAITGNSGGYIRLNPPENPQELLILDSDDITTAQNVWRFNLAGFGHSSTGYDGTYATAILQDGRINADFITTGTLTANIIKAGILSSPTGKFSFNLDTGHISASDIDITGGNISMDGGTLRSSSSKGGIDLSPGYISLAYNASGQGFLWNLLSNKETGLDILMTGVGRKLLGNFSPTDGWYATFATSIPDTSSEEKNRRGFRFATNSDHIIHSGTAIGLTSADLWENTLALIENDAFRIRDVIKTNEALANRFAGLIHYRSDGSKSWNVGFGAGSYRDGSGKIEVKNSGGEILAALDIYTESLGNSVTLRAQSGNTAMPPLKLGSSILYWGTTQISTSSTERIKKDIEPIAFSASDKIQNTQMYSYHYKDEYTHDGKSDTITRYGLVVERECPEEVIDTSGDSINLYSMCSLGWKAIQEILQRLDRMEASL